METPVLLVAFNRPKQIEKVIDAIVASGATSVFIAIDGPRESHPDDTRKNREIRHLIERTRWPGAVTTLYRDTNYGCRQGVSGAISWFFDHVQEGIILEDDCLPDSTFFPYAEELLRHFRDDERIGMISGSTFFPLSDEHPSSYTFTRYPHVWGWATWKRAWNHYDEDLASWRGEEGLNTVSRVSGGSRDFERFWKRMLDGVRSGEVDSWAYIWSYSFWRARMLGISPGVNLIENLGFSSDATHTRGKPLGKAFRPKHSRISFPLEHATTIATDVRHERLTRNLAMGVHGKTLRTLMRLLWIIIHALPFALKITTPWRAGPRRT